MRISLSREELSLLVRVLDRTIDANDAGDPCDDGDESPATHYEFVNNEDGAARELLFKLQTAEVRS